MKIDAHQHFWKYNPVRDAWIDDSMTVIRKDFLPQDLKPILEANTIDGCIAVQADQSENETDFLLQCAIENPFIKGVVGWVDLLSDNVEERLEYYSKNNILKGVRHIVQAEANDFMLRKDFQNGISKLQQFNLTYDILVFPPQLEAAIQLVREFPNQKFVLDHIAKPYIKDAKIHDWKINMSTLAKAPNVYCKVSGMVTEADLKQWRLSDFQPYLDVVFEAFGIDRIMYGSDWPVCLLAAEYQEQLNIIETYISRFSSDDKIKIMGNNAIRFYNL
ncbi:amidohydrolase family protein [Flavivirga spongiicola]|uniref:Amidohydrolase family protein n=1 Tax=Flavivirga spongiicola TaxID=421621 RepID=A0ABU7XP72_9FLAO|nr:amidohydrolase family protein [Flavivirga sp. MEBiC05379]MDO5977370.1 amidohydrolase family protein [Flavivirga sp. MEBiC05379]